MEFSVYHQCVLSFYLSPLADKAGGKKFAKDFEEGSAKLQEYVSVLDGQVKKGPALLEALQNADIFYEMQYKEVKIVTKVSNGCILYWLRGAFLHLSQTAEK